MKDKSIHPLKLRVVNTIEVSNGNGLVKTEDKLFFDTVKQLISQFRKNFDASQDGGEQQKRENEFIDFTYLRLSKQLEKLELETVDYKKIINEGFEALGPELNHDVDVKIRDIIEQAIQKYFQEHKETRKSQVLTEVDTDKEIEKLSGDEKLLKVLDDLFGKDEKFKEQTEKQRQLQEEFKKELLKTFKNNLVK